MWSLEDVYLLSQVIAVIAVVPSLVYLAVQVRQNTRQLRANSTYQFIEATGEVNLSIASSPENANLIRRGMDDPTILSEDENLRFIFFVGQYFQIYSAMFDLKASKMLPITQWATVEKDIKVWLDTAGGLSFWQMIGVSAFEEPFCNYVNKVVLPSVTAYSMDLSGADRTEDNK